MSWKTMPQQVNCSKQDSAAMDPKTGCGLPSTGQKVRQQLSDSEFLLV